MCTSEYLWRRDDLFIPYISKDQWSNIISCMLKLLKFWNGNLSPWKSWLQSIIMSFKNIFDYESSSVTMKKLYNCSRSKYFNWISSSTSPSREDYGYSSELIVRFITRLILLPVSTCNVYGDNRQNISDVETIYSFLISKNINSISILTCVHLAVGTNTSFAQDF